jgi:hypothetical protein
VAGDESQVMRGDSFLFIGLTLNLKRSADLITPGGPESMRARNINSHVKCQMEVVYVTFQVTRRRPG